MYQNPQPDPVYPGAMLAVGAFDAARLASLASGRGGIPEPNEWPFVLAVLVLLGVVGTRVLMALGLTRTEALGVCAIAPALVLVDAPLGELAPGVGLAANSAGCLIPSAIAVKVVLERRAPFAEAFFLVALSVVVSYFSSHVEPQRGVLLQYRVPGAVVGIFAAALLFRTKGPSWRSVLMVGRSPGAPGGVTGHGTAGATAFAAGALGVVIGADVFHFGELAVGAAGGRVILGGAGLLDGILLVAVLSAGVGELVATGLRAVVPVRKRAAA